MVWGLIAAVVLFISVFLYLKDLVLWRRSLQRDLARLSARRETCPPQTRKALSIVTRQCRNVLGFSFRSEAAIRQIPLWLTSLAGCYYPGEAEPCLQVTPERIIRGVELSLPRYQKILERPGFHRVARLSIRDITTPRGGMGFALRFRCLWLMRYLLADLLMYLGELAILVYSEQLPAASPEETAGVEETLRELSDLRPSIPVAYPEEIQRIRNSLVGVPGILVKEPTPSELGAALVRAAEILAANCFPESPIPLHEAKIGPLAVRLKVFLSDVGRKDNYPFKARILSVRLSTLFNPERVSGRLLPGKITERLEKTLSVTGWLAWPLKVYLMTKSGVFWKFAADAGWFAGRKTLLVLFFGRCFDQAVKEIHTVYRMSQAQNRAPDDPKSAIDSFSSV